jgi:type II secretory pathway pseudopilin PulG
MDHSSTTRLVDRSTRTGFSIVELLVVIAIIIALLGTLIAALALAGRRAQSTQTQFFMTSISNALVSFKTDVGYLPPVLGRGASGGPTVGNARDLLQPPNWALDSNGNPTIAARNQLQDWYSFTSLPEYLLGYGDRTQDGHGAFQGITTPAGSPGAREPFGGIRSPGEDGVWGALLNPRTGQPLGTLGARNIVQVSGAYSAANVNPVALQGKVFGPYLQLNDEDSLGAINGFTPTGDPIIVRPGEVANFDVLPKVFLDYWGSPISYYRKAYPLADLRGREQPILSASGSQLGRDLGDIFALRPFEFRPGEDLPGISDGSGDNSTLGRLKSADFAIFSRGPDKAWEKALRRDPENFNRDNIVEAGQ